MHDSLKGAREALRGWFLGPRAENADLLERLVTEALRDHIFWRRNYHPEDGFTIREVDKRTPGYEDAVSTLTQELMGLLAELKRELALGVTTHRTLRIKGGRYVLVLKNAAVSGIAIGLPCATAKSRIAERYQTLLLQAICWRVRRQAASQSLG